jgi:hypothetical protein
MSAELCIAGEIIFTIILWYAVYRRYYPEEREK